MGIKEYYNKVKKGVGAAVLGLTMMTSPISGCGPDEGFTNIGGVYSGTVELLDSTKYVPKEDRKGDITFFVNPSEETGTYFWLNAWEVHEHKREGIGKFDSSWDNPKKAVLEFRTYGVLRDDGRLGFNAYMDYFSGCCGRAQIEWYIKTVKQRERSSEETMDNVKPVTLEDLCPSCVEDCYCP